MPEGRDEWVVAMKEAGVLHPPLAPPAACSRCLRPLEIEKRHWETCYPCGHEHPRTLPRISVVTYGAAGTRPWDFFTATKFEQTSAEKLGSFVNGIAAMLSATIEQDYPDFVDGDVDHLVIPLPSSHGLIRRCVSAMLTNGWPSLRVVDALTAADRPRQTGLNEASRRDAAAGKYTAAAAVAGRDVLLLDDAYTSGYTIHDAARAVVAAQGHVRRGRGLRSAYLSECDGCLSGRTWGGRWPLQMISSRFSRHAMPPSRRVCRGGR